MNEYIILVTVSRGTKGVLVFSVISHDPPKFRLGYS